MTTETMTAFMPMTPKISPFLQNFHGTRNLELALGRQAVRARAGGRR
jgi:hypothetical protein